MGPHTGAASLGLARGHGIIGGMHGSGKAWRTCFCSCTSHAWPVLGGGHALGTEFLFI